MQFRSINKRRTRNSQFSIKGCYLTLNSHVKSKPTYVLMTPVFPVRAITMYTL
ncbi:hypothetical protein B7P43_G08149 [Cryptotermes secundus]|uniref:Uncharacterized protein n=1 Tax=Cryptotermes secundus TaxID=105785 RepID=A0A2J7QA55_9NEOP|nr:hypothetical protein B7P43_G08149 [Cryptotermes secundus]